jgi:type I restriction enzyme S subunit
MNVPKGYKMTEIGVIPEDWEVKRIKDIAPLQRGFDLPVSTQETGEYPVVYSNGITSFHNSFTTKGPGVVTGRSGTLGKVHYVESDYWAHNTTLWVTNFLGNYPLYIYYLYSSLKLERFGSGSGVPTLNRNDVHDYYVAVPPLPEQRSIARVLSDTDELINALDKLIAKKRDIKKAVMQELLTGKTRLPGFSGEWEVKKLGDIGSFRGGNSFPTIYQGNIEGCYPFFKVSDMNNNGNEVFMVSANNYISELTQKKLCITVFPKGSIVFAKVGAAIFLERKKILNQPSCIDNNMMAFILNTNLVDTRFIHTMLHLKRFGCYVSTTALPSLSGKQLSEITIMLPPISEQQVIAQVLSDMDSEIAALEQRRDKMKAIKQGMMQELLTGRIRLH